MDPRLPTELRHIFRALLRAATYLPDALARRYVHDHVVYRFRQLSRKIEYRAKEGLSSDNLIERYHGSKNIAMARKAAKRLELAGQGSELELRRALNLTYGRAGRRRRVLLAKLMQVDENSLPADEMALERVIHDDANGKPLRFPHNSKFMAIMKSQMSKRPVELTEPVIRRSAPTIPKENTWGRKVPLKLQRSLTERHWKVTFGKILPPIPEHEWNMLRDLATGVIPAEKPVPRRTRGKRMPTAGDSNDERVFKYFTVPTYLHHSDFDDVRVDAENGATCWAPTIREAKLSQLNHFTFSQRYMRRLYASIWNITPTASLDPETDKWVVKWGGMRTRAHEGNFPKPTASDLEFWEGLDTHKEEKAARQ